MICSKLWLLNLQQGFSETLHAVFCLADNAVGPLAQRPDDIVHMYSGRTVEINNTDAEGRLVLGDGVSLSPNLRGHGMGVVQPVVNCISVCEGCELEMLSATAML